MRGGDDRRTRARTLSNRRQTRAIRRRLPHAGDPVDALDPEVNGAATVRERSPELDLSGHLVLPGLINAHDHLEFNLFPQLGRAPYPNPSAWPRDIYPPDPRPLRQQLPLPKPSRPSSAP